jgi:hypothetical protein
VVADREGEVTDCQEGRLTGGGGRDYARMEAGVMLTGSRRGGGCIFSFPIGILPDTLPFSIGGRGETKLSGICWQTQFRNCWLVYSPA